MIVFTHLISSLLRIKWLDIPLLKRFIRRLRFTKPHIIHVGELAIGATGYPRLWPVVSHHYTTLSVHHLLRSRFAVSAHVRIGGQMCGAQFFLCFRCALGLWVHHIHLGGRCSVWEGKELESGRFGGWGKVGLNSMAHYFLYLVCTEGWYGRGRGCWCCLGRGVGQLL